MIGSDTNLETGQSYTAEYEGGYWRPTEGVLRDRLLGYAFIVDPRITVDLALNQVQIFFKWGGLPQESETVGRTIADMINRGLGDYAYLGMSIGDKRKTTTLKELLTYAAFGLGVVAMLAVIVNRIAR